MAKSKIMQFGGKVPFHQLTPKQRRKRHQVWWKMMCKRYFEETHYNKRGK